MFAVRAQGQPRSVPYSALTAFILGPCHERIALGRWRRSFAIHVVQAIYASTVLLPLNVDIKSQSGNSRNTCMEVISFEPFLNPKQNLSTHNPINVKVNSALYIRQTMIPRSSFQCSISQT